MWGQLNNREELTFSSCTSLDDVEPWCYTRVQVSLDIIDSGFLFFFSSENSSNFEITEQMPSTNFLIPGKDSG